MRRHDGTGSGLRSSARPSGVYECLRHTVKTEEPFEKRKVDRNRTERRQPKSGRRQEEGLAHVSCFEQHSLVGEGKLVSPCGPLEHRGEEHGESRIGQPRLLREQRV